MKAQIQELRNQGYLVIATLQYFEFYHYPPTPQQQSDFRALGEAGAAAVSGSQGHHAQGFDFYNGAFIHYGLGNLFFDQYHMGLPTGQGFIDRHIFYDGRYIGTELTGIRFIDFARPRPMTPEERQDLLKSAFDASLW